MEDSRYTKLIEHVILEQLAKGKTFTFTLTGNSMHPLIRKGDRVHIQGCDPPDLSAGDIITYRNDDLYVTHRVVWITKKGNDIKLITKGDNEIISDPPVSPVRILGKVVGIGGANRTLNLESTSWRFMNRLLGVFSLFEAISIQLYRFAAGKFLPVRTSSPAIIKAPLLYRRIKHKGLCFTTGIIP